MVVELVTTIFLVLICTMKNYIHRTDMNTDADEVKHRTDDVGDEDHQHQWCNGNDEGNWFGVRYLHHPTPFAPSLTVAGSLNSSQ